MYIVMDQSLKIFYTWHFCILKILSELDLMKSLIFCLDVRYAKSNKYSKKNRPHSPTKNLAAQQLFGVGFLIKNNRTSERKFLLHFCYQVCPICMHFQVANVRPLM